MALIDVHFKWDDRFGKCYECGRPAAYTITPPTLTRPEDLRCSVCAAQAAADGEYIVWLFADE